MTRAVGPDPTRGSQARNSGALAGQVVHAGPEGHAGPDPKRDQKPILGGLSKGGTALSLSHTHTHTLLLSLILIHTYCHLYYRHVFTTALRLSFVLLLCHILLCIYI